jgi:hypothetical protein
MKLIFKMMDKWSSSMQDAKAGAPSSSELPSSPGTRTHKTGSSRPPPTGGGGGWGGAAGDEDKAAGSGAGALSRGCGDFLVFYGGSG